MVKMRAGQHEFKDPTDSECLAIVTGAANQFELNLLADVLQGRKEEAISIARKFRGDLMRLMSGEPSPAINDIDLTDRELEILKWAARGKSANVTAQIMDLTEKSVVLNRKSLGIKLNSFNITQSVATATRLGLL